MGPCSSGCERHWGDRGIELAHSKSSADIGCYYYQRWLRVSFLGGPEILEVADTSWRCLEGQALSLKRTAGGGGSSLLSLTVRLLPSQLPTSYFLESMSLCPPSPPHMKILLFIDYFPSVEYGAKCTTEYAILLFKS